MQTPIVVTQTNRNRNISAIPKLEELAFLLNSQILVCSKKGIVFLKIENTPIPIIKFV